MDTEGIINDFFIPEEKMSKRQRKKLNNARRNKWAINPITRKPKNSSAYDRNKVKKQMEEKE